MLSPISRNVAMETGRFTSVIEWWLIPSWQMSCLPLAYVTPGWKCSLTAGRSKHCQPSGFRKDAQATNAAALYYNYYTQPFASILPVVNIGKRTKRDKKEKHPINSCRVQPLTAAAAAAAVAVVVQQAF